MTDTEFLDLVFGERSGFVAVAYGSRPYLDERGKYKHQEWRELRYAWPAERESLVTEVKQELGLGDPVDIYMCPALRLTDARNGFGGKKGTNAAPVRVLWADCDHDIDTVTLTKLDALVAASGQHGHRHVYVALDEAVPVATHRTLNKALAAYLGADTKWSDDALLRLPGSLNFKPTLPANGGPSAGPADVTLIKRNARAWSVADIAAVLGVDLTTAPQRSATSGATFDTPEAEPVPEQLPPLVRRALEHPDTVDKSAAHHRLVGACRDSGLTLGQAITVCGDYGPSDTKYGDRLAEEVARSWEKIEDKGPGADADPSGVPNGTPRALLPGLPVEFWDARPVLSHIRQAAWARVQSPDAVFYTVLAKLSATRNNRLRVDSGISTPASLNTFVGLVGHSGDGKTQGVGVGDALVRHLFLLDWRGLLGVGSGEGIAEAYMGMVQLDPDGKKERGQVHYNALFYVDEGQQLNRLLFERTGATTGAALRSAWVGGDLGQQNATAERTRLLQRDSYALGLIVGYQPEVVAQLLADGATGMPQRFLWSTTTDPTIPDERVPWPGELELDTNLIGRSRDMAMAPEIRDELYQQRLAIKRGQIQMADLDGHAPLMLVKVSALLALLENRASVTLDDWALAKTVWDTSCAVRDQLVAHAAEVARREARQRSEAGIERAVGQQLAIEEIPRQVERLARKITAYLAESPQGRLSNREIKDRLSSRDRPFRSRAYDLATENGWLTLDGSDFVLVEFPAKAA